MADFQDDLNRIITDNLSSSSAIATFIVDFFESHSGVSMEQLGKASETLVTNFSGMGIVRNVCRKMIDGISGGQAPDEAGEKIFDEIELELQKSVTQASKILEKGMSVVTMSRSSQVENVILANSDIIGEVYVLESRPMSEGIGLHKFLLENEIRSTLLTDASAGLAAEQADIALTGSDSVLSDHTLIHKIGTLPLFTLMKALGKKRYVLTTTMRFEGQYDYKSYPAFTKHSCDEIAEGLSHCSNLYFEKIRADLVTAYIGDRGIFNP